MSEAKGTDLAPPGAVWVCAACGRRSRTRYGFDENNNRTNLSDGWDESCMMNAVLCRDAQPYEAVEKP